MNKLLVAASAAALAIVGMPAQALAPTATVNITAEVTEACAFAATNTALTLAFGTVPSQAAAGNASATASLKCSSGVKYYFSTADGTPSSSYDVYIGDTTTGAGDATVSLTVSPQASTSANPTPPALPGQSTAPAAPVVITTVRNGTGDFESITFSAKLESASGSNKAPTKTGTVSATKILYVVYS